MHIEGNSLKKVISELVGSVGSVTEHTTGQIIEILSDPSQHMSYANRLTYLQHNILYIQKVNPTRFSTPIVLFLLCRRYLQQTYNTMSEHVVGRNHEQINNIKSILQQHDNDVQELQHNLIKGQFTNWISTLQEDPQLQSKKISSIINKLYLLSLMTPLHGQFKTNELFINFHKEFTTVVNNALKRNMGKAFGNQEDTIENRKERVLKNYKEYTGREIKIDKNYINII